jgi:hypothetical protein
VEDNHVGFRFKTSENASVECVVVTGPRDDYVWVAFVGPHGVQCNRARLASATRLRHRVNSLGVPTLGLLSSDKVDDIIDQLLTSHETPRPVLDFLLSLLGG